MSQLNFAAHGDPENQHRHRNVKQFGTSEINRPTMKKTVLTDVKNILTQRTVQSAKKLQTSATKSHILKKNFYDKENKITKKEVKKHDVELLQTRDTCATSYSVFTNEAESVAEPTYVEPVCSFCNKVEDDYADILLKDITLTKSQIDTLALEWERTPIVSEKDMRKIGFRGAVPKVVVSNDLPLMFDYEQNELDFNLLNDIPAVESIAEFED